MSLIIAPPARVQVVEGVAGAVRGHVRAGAAMVPSPWRSVGLSRRPRVASPLARGWGA